MKVKHLRPGDWVVTWYNEGVDPRVKVQGLLISVVRRPGNNEGSLAYVLSNLSGLHTIKASHILERRASE